MIEANIQNIPQEFDVVKQNFIPKLDTLMFVDYSQIELRLLAYYLEYIGDSSMAEVFKAGRDLHAETAKGIFDLNCEPTPDERFVGKTLNFAITYQGGIPTVMELLNVKSKEADEILTKYHKTWPSIGRHRYCKCHLEWCPDHDPYPGTLCYILREANRRRGYSKTLIGRKVKPTSDHKILSSVVQGGAAEIMKEAMLVTHQSLEMMEFTSHLVSTIHDELILDCVTEEVPALALHLPDWMDYPLVTEVVPFKVDIEVSNTSWADKEIYGG